MYFFLLFLLSHDTTLTSMSPPPTPTSTTTPQRASYTLEAIAEDRGTPPLSRTVEVEIDVVDRSNKPPVWDQRIYGPIYVKENTAVGETVTSVKARSVQFRTNPFFDQKQTARPTACDLEKALE
jgi:hypothetical protein